MHKLEVPEPVRRQFEERGGVDALVALLADKRALVRVASTLQALSEPIRLKVLLLLREQPLCPCILTRVLDVADSRLSYHLSALQKTRLVEAKHKGRWLIYSLTKQGRKALRVVAQLRNPELERAQMKNATFPSAENTNQPLTT